MKCNYEIISSLPHYLPSFHQPIYMDTDNKQINMCLFGQLNFHNLVESNLIWIENQISI
jgi:hypothetical protein